VCAISNLALIDLATARARAGVRTLPRYDELSTEFGFNVASD
jgi:hypothetical protein